ncbi:ABC transporter ATP-binding protein [Lacticaseibacillus nasuensis]|uniref:ABC transporter ATP-binding protein n=1 Tax=Lacticaseibacillus nasuensis TaxID=944671 RepID=UPI0022479595|nr:ABC transporter ATP-binding protein [Lacticaseibacillus nasuensis]MCX2454973.1 ABC transporter ATP-binding protein [Lacticaseibacillus nasuensis]
MTEVLTVDHLQKRFGQFQALKDISFSIHAGEVFGFIGPNGAGKSTTIRTLLGILRPTAGHATIFGLDAWRDAVKIHRRLAYVPGDVNLWPNLTGGEVIDFLLRLNGQQHSARTDALIKQFELDPTKKARTYSKGNRQKVALIAALSSDAELYIFDEPTSGLDPLMEEVFQQQVLALKQAGKSVLLSSHILSEVERMCDRIAIIRQGAIIEVGSLAEMRQLSRSTVHVTTQQPLTALAKLPAVHQFTATAPTQAVFAVDAEAIGTVITAVSQLGIVQLATTPPTLEDLFLRYYNEGDGQNEQ